MSKSRKRGARPLWFPVYWPAWAGIFVLFLIAHLPMPAKQRWGKSIGCFLKQKLKSRYRVAKINIQACFPELSESEQEQLVEDSFIACSRGFLESTHAWWRPMTAFEQSTEVLGREHLQQALDRGQGLLLIGAHYSIFDFALPLIACNLPNPGYMYRPNDNPVIDRTIENGRRRHFNIRPFTKRELPEMIQFLKDGGQVWYACDQDFGCKSEVFASFFGMDAACITAPSYIARESGAAVICVSHLRTPEGHYQVRFSPIAEGFGEDQQQDAETWNQFIESTIRRYPDQYLWLHKRFKTRPEGVGKLY